jgi:asparagine synthase (glutamine-hydrolysing)
VCGIAGAIDVAAERAAVRVASLNDAQEHRGPDHKALTQVGNFTLGNTHLAIQNPGPAGNQPFVSADGRYHCVFNIEIYNHRSLVRRFNLNVRTACDGKVIPELCATLGVSSLTELHGMFAIALVDSLEQRLYLARDPFRLKPLYWRAVPEGLLFSSELRSLTRIAGSVRIDTAAVARYLHLGAVAADRSPFLEIQVVSPNSVASFGLDSHATVMSVLPNGPLAGPATVAHLEAALTDSIEVHLAADVPTALLLSGGVDSATIAAASRRLGRDLHCLTIATDGAADESVEAACTARHYGHQLRRIPAVPDSCDVASFFQAMQRPSIDGLNTYVVAKAVHEAGFKVALSGLGGDEAVGGYSHFRLLRCLPILRALDRFPAPMHSAAAVVLGQLGVANTAKTRRLLAIGGPRDGLGICELQREILPETLVSHLTGIRRPQGTRPSDHLASGCTTPFGAVVAAEVDICLQARLLPDADSFSVASSVELRVPFVDRQVFLTALALATGAGTVPGKRAIGMALRDPFLKELAARPKRGFTMPMSCWMNGPLALVLCAASEPDAELWTVIDRDIAKRAGLLPLRAGRRWAEGWALAALNAWLSAI